MEDLMHSNYLFPPPSFSNHPRPSPADENAVKNRIMAHPYYPSLVAAYADCHKLGAPPEVAARLSAFSHDLQIRPSCANFSTADTELDLFMEAYCNILVKYRAEIATPLEEAAEFLQRAESQLSSITASRSVSSFRLSADHEKCGAACSANCEDRSDAGAFKEAVLGCEMRAEDREMKRHLLRKYGGYFGSLWQELSKKKKKGKLSNEARQKLLSWWELHKKWPYPSESEKMTLVESTGLDQKQINNWFINQRKRHWKPSEEMQVQMQFLIFNGYQEQQQQQQQNAMSFYMEGHFMGDGIYP